MKFIRFESMSHRLKHATFWAAVGLALMFASLAVGYLQKVAVLPDYASLITLVLSVMYAAYVIPKTVKLRFEK